MMTSSWSQQSPYSDQFGPAVDDVVTSTTTTTTDDHDGDDDDDDKKLPGVVIYPASCYCSRVKYHVRGDPESSKFCHCRGCQQLHGAPYEWVSIFHKQNVKFEKSSLEHLYFYSDSLDKGWDSKQAED